MVTALDDLEPVELCPRCAARAQGPNGFCDPCLAEHVAEDYVMRDAADIAERREACRRRSIAYEAAPSDAVARQRERQRQHRLLERVRPRELPRAGADPYQLAREALLHLMRIRNIARSKGPAVTREVTGR